MKKPDTDTRLALAVMAAAVLVAFAFQGSRGIYATTESRYAESSREMLETGDWLVPQLQYAPHWTKPPLAYWTIAGGMALLGVNAWGARLSSAVAFILTTWVVMKLGATLWDRRTGSLAGLMYAAAPFAVGAANSINTDTLLALWMALVVLAYWKARRRVAEGRPAGAWVVLLWLFAGLGFLTKGPPSLLVLGVVVICHLVDRRQGRPMPRLLSPVGIPLFLVVGLGWYVWAAATHPGLLDYWLGDEVVGRIGTDEFGRNTEWYKPLVVYLPPLAIGLGLWSLVAALPALRQTRALWRGGLRAAWRERPVLRFLLVWIVVPLIVFSLSQSRLPLYVLPLLPAVTLLTARTLIVAWPEPRLRRVVAIVGVAAIVIAIGGKALMAYVPSGKDERMLYRAVRRHAGDDARVLNCTNRELHGLMFYLHGHLEQVDLRGTDEQVADAIHRVVDRVADRPRGQRYVIVTRRKERRIAEAFDARGIPYKLTVEPQGAVTVVGKPPPAGDDAQENTAAPTGS